MKCTKTGETLGYVDTSPKDENDSMLLKPNTWAISMSPVPFRDLANSDQLHSTNTSYIFVPIDNSSSTAFQPLFYLGIKSR